MLSQEEIPTEMVFVFCTNNTQELRKQADINSDYMKAILMVCV